MVKIGDKMIDYNSDFKVFLCTRNSDIVLSPSEKGLLNMINFTVTRSGLEGKLLSIIINYYQTFQDINVRISRKQRVRSRKRNQKHR